MQPYLAKGIRRTPPVSQSRRFPGGQVIVHGCIAGRSNCRLFHIIRTSFMAKKLGELKANVRNGDGASGLSHWSEAKVDTEEWDNGSPSQH